MKKLVSWLLVVVMMLSLAACGGKNNDATKPAGSDAERSLAVG